MSRIENGPRRLVLRIGGVRLRVAVLGIESVRLCLLIEQHLQRNNISYDLSTQIPDQIVAGIVYTSWVAHFASCWLDFSLVLRVSCTIALRQVQKTCFRADSRLIITLPICMFSIQLGL